MRPVGAFGYRRSNFHDGSEAFACGWPVQRVGDYGAIALQKPTLIDQTDLHS